MPSLAQQSSPGARAAYLPVVLLGSYAVIWTFTGFAAVVLSCLGLARSEAAIFSSLLGFLLYLAVVITALAARRPLHFWVVLAVGGVLLTMFSRSLGAN